MVRDALGLVVDLPQRLGAIGEGLADARRDLRELVRTGKSQDARVARIEKSVAEFSDRLARIETLVSSLARDVDDATDRLPDKSKGPLGKAREALAGNGG
jgi:hypothetical protein